MVVSTGCDEMLKRSSASHQEGLGSWSDSLYPGQAPHLHTAKHHKLENRTTSYFIPYNPVLKKSSLAQHHAAKPQNTASASEPVNPASREPLKRSLCWYLIPPPTPPPSLRHLQVRCALRKTVFNNLPNVPRTCPHHHLHWYLPSPDHHHLQPDPASNHHLPPLLPGPVYSLHSSQIKPLD